MKKKLLIFTLFLTTIVTISSFATFSAVKNGEDDGEEQHVSNKYSGPGAIENPYANGNNVFGSGENTTNAPVNAGFGDAVADNNTIDTSQIFKYTFTSGVYFECPRNVMTEDGQVTTEDYVVNDKASGKCSEDSVKFSYTGLRNKTTEFYILAYDVNNLVIDTRTIKCYYDSDYNENKQKYVYKKLTENCYYYIPEGAVKVIVIGKLENAAQ